MRKILIITEDILSDKLKIIFSQNHIAYKLARGPLSVDKYLRSSGCKVVLWLDNPNFLQLFEDTVAVLNKFPVELYIYGIAELSEQQAAKIKINYKLIWQINNFLTPSVSEVEASEQGLSNNDAKFKLAEEIGFKHILRSKSKQKKILPKTPKQQDSYSADGLSNQERDEFKLPLDESGLAVPDSQKIGFFRKIFSSK
ncbi:MAG: hypothetical protein JJV97_02195 [SAR324 cluster bacterium]|nr:hypothetical protein [SAR324 cluster bacterium]